MAIALAAAISMLSGYLLTDAVWPHARGTVSAWLMKLSLAAGLGLGISSCGFFVTGMAGGDHFVVSDILLLAVIFVLYVLIRVRSGRPIPPNWVTTDFEAPGWLRLVLASSFVVTTFAALYCSGQRMVAHEHGDGWDAFAIWNLHARFLFLGGPHWRDGFNALIPWSHPDYPLLLPAAIARFWSYLGHDNPAVPSLIGFVFTLCTVTLLVSSLAQLRGRNAAMLSGIALSATPFFIEQGAAQYADIPLSFFILASIVLLHFGFRSQWRNNLTHLHGPWLLAGLSAGFAGWTKNEGLLFLGAIFLAHLLTFRARPSSESAPEKPTERKYEISFVLGLIPVLVVIIWFRHSVATAGDLLSSPAIMLEKILTPSRYLAILRWYVKDLLRFGEWWLVPETALLPIFYLLVRKKRIRYDPLLRSSSAALALTFAGYFVIYLITPRDLYWHLRFSLNRLFLQLWPATLFLFFLFVGRQSPAPSQNEPEIP